MDTLEMVLKIVDMGGTLGLALLVWLELRAYRAILRNAISEFNGLARSNGESIAELKGNLDSVVMRSIDARLTALQQSHK